jgi:hypothetical protein
MASWPPFAWFLAGLGSSALVLGSFALALRRSVARHRARYPDGLPGRVASGEASDLHRRLESVERRLAKLEAQHQAQSLS